MQVKLFVIFSASRPVRPDHKICEKTPPADTRASLPGAFFVIFCFELSFYIWFLVFDYDIIVIFFGSILNCENDFKKA